MGFGGRVIAGLLICGCAASAVSLPSDVDASRLRDGDIVLLPAGSWRGALVTAANADHGAYAHAGMVGFVGHVPYLYHATPEHGVGGVALQEFLSRHRIHQPRLLRYTDPQLAPAALAYVRAQQRQRTPFDRDFDLGDASAQYCTELVWRAYLAAGIDLLAGRRATLRRAPLLGPVLWPGDFEYLPGLQPVIAQPTLGRTRG